MVDVSEKAITLRTAVARGRIYITQSAISLLSEDFQSPADALSLKSKRKGDVIATAKLAGIMGAKKTAELIPLCHQILLNRIDVQLTIESSTSSVLCTATVSSSSRTGVEMEALAAVSASLLTIWDMLKAMAGQEMVISDMMVVAKEGGKTDFRRQ